MTGRRRADHVLAVMAGVDPAEPRAHCRCTHCGAKLVIELPIEVSVYVAASKAFVAAHRRCPAPASVHIVPPAQTG